jgi:hypothetical protein
LEREAEKQVRNAYKILVERDYLEDLDVDGTTISKYMLKKRFSGVLEWIYSAFCEHGNEPSGSRNGGEILH